MLTPNRRAFKRRLAYVVQAASLCARLKRLKSSTHASTGANKSISNRAAFKIPTDGISEGNSESPTTPSPSRSDVNGQRSSKPPPSFVVE